MNEEQKIHWANDYIGLPWEKGAEGPDTYDCYGLLRVVQRRYYDVEMPRLVEVDRGSILAVVRAIRRNPENKLWEAIAAPCDGCLVKMHKQDNPDHIGVWLDTDGGGVLHCCQAYGVGFDSFFDLSIMGWRGITYHRRIQ